MVSGLKHYLLRFVFRTLLVYMYIPSLGFASSIMHSGNGVMYYPNFLLILVYTVCYVCLQILMGCLRYKEFQILESVMWSRPTRTLFNGGNLYICCVGLTSPYCMFLFFLLLFPLQMRVCYPVSNNLAILGFYTFSRACAPIPATGFHRQEGYSLQGSTAEPSALGNN